MANNHNGAHPGKRVRVKLKDRTVFVAHFMRNEGKYTWFEPEGGGIPFETRRDHIMSLSIYKPQNRVTTGGNNITEGSK